MLKINPAVGHKFRERREVRSASDFYGLGRRRKGKKRPGNNKGFCFVGASGPLSCASSI